MADSPHFTQVPHAVLEALARAPFPGQHHRVLAVISRETFGWHRAVHRMATSFIAERTGIDRRAVVVILADLVRWGVVVIENQRRGAIPRLGVQCDVALWAIGTTSEQQRLARRRAKQAQPAWTSTQVPAPATCMDVHAPPARTSTQVPARTSMHTRERKEPLRKNQNQSAGGPDERNIVLEDLRQPARAEQLRDRAIRAGWGMINGRCTWAGDGGRIAWHTAVEHALGQTDPGDDPVRIFAAIAREGLRRGSPVDEDIARATCRMLDLSRPLPNAVEHLLDRMRLVKS